MGQFNLTAGCTNSVSNDENWVLELLGAVWGKPFNGTYGPFIRYISVGAVVKIYPEKIHPLVRTQESTCFRLDSRCVGKLNRHGRKMGDSHAEVTSRVTPTMVSNMSLIVTLSSLKLSAPEMAASA